MINNVKGNTQYVQGYGQTEWQSTKNAGTMTEQYDEAAVLELKKTPAESSATYSKPKARNIDYDEVKRLIEETERSCKGLRDIVQSLISKQGKKLEDLLAGKDVLIVDDETRAKAEEAISEDGEWGVKAVSDRLVAFAKAISGNDKTKVGELKDAISKGFKEAERLFGGKLPEISHKTYDETMRKLDEWAGSED